MKMRKVSFKVELTAEICDEIAQDFESRAAGSRGDDREFYLKEAEAARNGKISAYDLNDFFVFHVLGMDPDAKGVCQFSVEEFESRQEGAVEFRRERQAQHKAELTMRNAKNRETILKKYTLEEIQPWIAKDRVGRRAFWIEVGTLVYGARNAKTAFGA